MAGSTRSLYQSVLTRLLYEYSGESSVSPGNKGYYPVLEDTAFKDDLTLALKAPDPDVSPDSDYLPLVAATGVLFLEANHIAQFYFDSHYACSGKSRQTGINLFAQ